MPQFPETSFLPVCSVGHGLVSKALLQVRGLCANGFFRNYWGSLDKRPLKLCTFWCSGRLGEFRVSRSVFRFFFRKCCGAGSLRSPRRKPRQCEKCDLAAKVRKHHMQIDLLSTVAHIPVTLPSPPITPKPIRPQTYL